MKATGCDKLVTAWAWLSGLVLTVSVATLLGFLLIKGIGTLSPVLFLETPPP